MNQPTEPDSLPEDDTPPGTPDNGADVPVQELAPSLPAGSSAPAEGRRPSYVLLAVVSLISLAADLGTKWWALHALERPLPNGDSISTPIEITPWLTMLLARNRGGAWGLLQTANESMRKPFFLIISVLAILFIVYLYRKLHPKQHALRWGLPLVLGGAVGNLVDRVRYGWVIDFIDYRAEWVRWLNVQIARIWDTHAPTDHWPTFNIADVAICVGVGLMAIDMFTSRHLAISKDAEMPVSDDPVPETGPMVPGEEPEGASSDPAAPADDKA